MSRLIQTLGILLFVSSVALAGNKAEDLQLFLNDIVELHPDQLTGSEPLIQVTSILNEKATKKIILTKDNMTDALQEAASFNYAIIIVEKHTIVKITDLNDHILSGAWGTSMPKGTALIQKSGAFIEQTNYINNLIGIPDNRKRTLYLFK